MSIDTSQKVIDVRDLIARAEEMQTEAAELLDQDLETELSDETEGELRERGHFDLADEIEEMREVLDELSGNGGDEQWRGNWYPVTLIRDSYFETAMDELLEDIGDIPKNIPPYLRVVVDYHALQMDYTSIIINGVTYWYR